MSPTLTFNETIFVPSASMANQYGARAIRRNRYGIAISGLILDGTQPVVLMADMSFANSGCSLTNCIQAVVNFVAEAFLAPNHFTIGECAFISLDTQGRFDVVRPVVTDKVCRDVRWTPLDNRTMAAFELRYGNYATELMHGIGLLCVTQRRPLSLTPALPAS